MTTDMGLQDPALNPQGLFETVVKPEIVPTCEGCHQTTQTSGTETVSPFLVPGNEYQSITTYNSGEFLTATASQSPLLTKGAHQGPALTTQQSSDVLAWLQGEALARGSASQSPTTPTVAIRTGSFYINLNSLLQTFTPPISDPLANITFDMASFGGPYSYEVTNLTLTAGPATALHIKHPIFIIFSAVGAEPDPSDALSTVDVQTPTPSSSVTIGTGSVLLDDLPASTARLALAFQQINAVGQPGPPPMCKDFGAFSPAVTNQLATCASICHSANGTDPRSSQAYGAFDMGAALGTDMTAMQTLCVYALGRLNLQNLSQSVLILQPEPTSMGGTSNHPYKLDSSSFPPFQSAVMTWGMGE
jgi:hypothetical protein